MANDQLEMPKVKAYENGELEILPGHENGWARTHPTKNTRDTMTNVFFNTEHSAELVVICSTLQPGESVYVVLAPALMEMFHHECYIVSQVGDSTEGYTSAGDDVLLAYTVNMGFADLAAAYNETEPDYSWCE